MEQKNTLAGRYEVRLKSKRGRDLIVDRTDCHHAALKKAADVRGIVYDTRTERVYSPQTGTWLKPITQDVIDQELEKQSEDPDFLRIAQAIGRDMLEGSPR